MRRAVARPTFRPARSSLRRTARSISQPAMPLIGLVTGTPPLLSATSVADGYDNFGCQRILPRGRYAYRPRPGDPGPGPLLPPPGQVTQPAYLCRPLGRLLPGEVTATRGGQQRLDLDDGVA